MSALLFCMCRMVASLGVAPLRVQHIWGRMWLREKRLHPVWDMSARAERSPCAEAAEFRRGSERRAGREQLGTCAQVDSTTISSIIRQNTTVHQSLISRSHNA